jgi:hypothetical protein
MITYILTSGCDNDHIIRPRQCRTCCDGMHLAFLIPMLHSVFRSSASPLVPPVSPSAVDVRGVGQLGLSARSTISPHRKNHAWRVHRRVAPSHHPPLRRGELHTGGLEPRTRSRSASVPQASFERIRLACTRKVTAAQRSNAHCSQSKRCNSNSSRKSGYISPSRYLSVASVRTASL